MVGVFLNATRSSNPVSKSVKDSATSLHRLSKYDEVSDTVEREGTDELFDTVRTKSLDNPNL